VLIYHVEEFLKRTGKPLGIYTEQCSEAVHANFKKTYKRYACNEAFEGHGEKLSQVIRACAFRIHLVCKICKPNFEY